MPFSADPVVASKLVALAIFVPIYLGALFYALRPANAAAFAHYAALPIQDDEEDAHGR